jgi:hypothetical protein
MCPNLRTMTTSTHDVPKSHDATISHDALCEKPQACQCDIREMEWLAREALALTSDKEPWLFSLARPAEYAARKRALLVYIEATL